MDLKRKTGEIAQRKQSRNENLIKIEVAKTVTPEEHSFAAPLLH